MQRTPATFDVKDSFRIGIDRGVIGIDAADLGALMNRYVFGAKDSPIRNTSIQVRGGHLVIGATLHKGVDVHIVVEARPEVAAGGNGIRLRTSTVHAAGIPVRGLMDALGMEIAKLVEVHEARGFSISDDDFPIDPQRMLAPPPISGTVEQVEVDDHGMVLRFSIAYRT